MAVQPSVTRITEIDIDRPARALAVLRWSDFILVVGCGLWALGMLPELFRAAINAQWLDLLLQTSIVSTLVFAAYTGWRHVGVIDPRVWRSYLWVFPLMVALATLVVFEIATTFMSQGAKSFEDPQSFVALFSSLQFALVAIPGFVCVLLLRRTRVAPMGVRLDGLLSGLTARGGEAAPHVTRVQRVAVGRGVAYGLLGLTILLVATLAPIPAGRQASNVARVIQQVIILGFFFIVRARRYFQVSADSLLEVDKRSPILFLRSFADDEQQQYGNSQRALLDFSLETRLANHFHRFGPFIAIGSPKETVPQPGAARVLLSDDEWQSRVLGWMTNSNLIIMYCGTTHWVNWELRRVVESGRATSLILMFPEIKGWRSSRRKKDIAARVEQIREVFKDTPWTEELMTFDDFAGLRAMVFRGDGSMVMVKSRSRSRDAYHLAALVAHQQLLDGSNASYREVAPVEEPSRRRRVAFAGILTAATAVAGAVYLSDTSAGPQLTFKQGVLSYDASVPLAVATGVGEYLVRREYFSDDKAVTVQLHRERGVYRLRFVIDPAHANDPLANIQFGIMGTDITREVLDGQSIEVALYDPQLQPIKVVPASAKLAFGKGELYFTDPIAMDEARRVGERLKESEFFGDERETAVHLGREDGTYQLRFVIDPSRAADPEIVGAFRELGGAIAVLALEGQPVVVHLCDSELRSLKRERVESLAVSR